jgi:hypothetical protein
MRVGTAEGIYQFSVRRGYVNRQRQLLTVISISIMGASLMLSGYLLFQGQKAPVPLVTAFELPPRLMGWNLKGMNWQLTPQSWESPAVLTQIRSYGANGIRRHFTAEYWLDPAIRDQYAQRFHNVAQWSADRGMWVIFDLYSRTAGASGNLRGTQLIWTWETALLVQVWQLVATELRGYGNVLLELGNEPNDVGPPNPGHREIWVDKCRAMIQAIRDVGFTGYLVIPLPEAATDGGTFLTRFAELLAVDPLKRLIIDFHHYHYWHHVGTSATSIRAWLQRHGISQLRARGYRVLCGEFGVKGTTAELTWYRHFLEILLADGYDMMVEAYQLGDFSQLTGDSIATGQLNTAGRLFADSMTHLAYYARPS